MLVELIWEYSQDGSYRDRFEIHFEWMNGHQVIFYKKWLYREAL